MPRRARRPRLRIALGVLGLALGCVALSGFVSTDYLRAFGSAPTAAELLRMRASPHFVINHFENVQATGVMKGGMWGATWHWIFGKEMRAPTCPLPLAVGGASRLGVPPRSGLRITWLGHSTTLIEIDGARVLTDPMWSERASPSRWAGPRRFHPPPIALADLPRVDAVVISHEHYDHLDMATIQALAPRGVAFHVPLGIGAHLAGWGVPAAQIFEHDWWDGAKLASGVELVSTPARHFNGRGVPTRTGALWTSWSLVGPEHRVFFSGDTGRSEVFREVAAREGPFDVALLEIGQFDPSWGDIHLGPRGALDVLGMLGAKRMLPIHWGTFELAMHAWSEPAETLTVEAKARGLTVVTPGLGEPIEPTLDEPTTAWWRALPPTAASCP